MYGYVRHPIAVSNTMRRKRVSLVRWLPEGVPVYHRGNTSTKISLRDVSFSSFFSSSSFFFWIYFFVANLLEITRKNDVDF